MYKCICGKEFEKKQSYSAHCGHCSERGKSPHLFNSDGSAWNKGLTKDTDIRVMRNSKSVSKSLKGSKRSPLSYSHRKSISDSMKKAHAEGRAHNIGMCRWNNEPSYPEKFFSSVIENEFEDKNYVREFPVGKYSIDFAWVDKKLAIEIDGEQHDALEQSIHDKEKDKYLSNNGWKVLRVKWKQMFNNTKIWIQICKDFVDKHS